MKREQGKKASQKRLNLTPFLCGGGARSSKAARVCGRLSVFSLSVMANSPEAARQIYAKRQGKKLSQI
ncbi:hypothetical protein M7835_000401 [Campylobacter upsaliensis]|nr:hypothetical protein [Campylobacter upsaliensis]